MPKFFRSFLFLALIASTAWAAKPIAKIDGPKIVSGSSFLLSGAGSTADDRFPLEWVLFQGPTAVLEPYDKGGRIGVVCYVRDAQEGEYLFLLKAKGVTVQTTAGVTESIADVDAAFHAVRVGPPPPPPLPPPGPKPDPQPDPKPDPIPDPIPVVTGRIFATYIADAANMTEFQAELKGSALIRSELNKLNANYRWYQSDESELVMLRLLPKATAEGLPCMIFQSADGKLASVLKAPTEEQIITETKRLRGAK